MRRLLPLSLLLSACGPIPVQMSSQKQTQSSKQEVAQEVANDLEASNASSHASKQGTNSMPVIIICNNTNSPSARCATVPENGALLETVQGNMRGKKP
jgi:hypothetical protein